MIFRGRYFDRCCGGWHCDGLAGTFVPAAEPEFADAFLGLLPFYLFLCAGKDQGCHGLHTESGDLIHVDALYMGVILKMIGITYISEFASAICKDAGLCQHCRADPGIGEVVDLSTGEPVLMAFLSTVEAFL